MKYDLVLRATEVLKNGGVPNIAMVTNGWFLTKDRVISLRNAGLTHIQLSLDGKDAKTHERMRGINGIYEKARKKKAEWDAKVKDLERRYQEEENTEIHDLVHAANLNPDQLGELLRMFASDMIPKPEIIKSMNEEEKQDEI